MDITVAVCARNAEKHIADCLESINNQTVKPAHVFVIDDHSTDATAEIARRLRARVIMNEGHQLYDGRNTTLKYCDTEALAFTDADCIPDEKWVENIMHVFQTRDVAGGSGRHPPFGSYGFAGWIHHMWFLVETEKTGYTGGIIGGNCYFRTDALKEVGGWISLPFSNAEDVYIAKKLTDAGYRVWFDEKIIARHKYTNNFADLMKKAAKAGEAITVMMKVTGCRDGLWWYTLVIPVVAVTGIGALILLLVSIKAGLIAVALVFGGSLGYLCYRFKSLTKAIPRFFARWILIWPYSLGIVYGLIARRVFKK